MILIVASKKDTAAINIAHQLLAHHSFDKSSKGFQGEPVYFKKTWNDEAVNLVFIEEEAVNAQFITDAFTPRLLIFLSRHHSESGIPTLSVHTPGNLVGADLGGLPRKISISPASAMKEALKAMKIFREEMDLDYEVSYECTHHGPSLDAPAMFVELGSSPAQWNDMKAAKVVADAAMVAASNEKSYPTALGIGGPHYNRKFTRMALENDIAFGHIIPKYAISKIDIEMMRQCIDKTVEHVEKIVLDWKGIKGEDKYRLINTLNKIHLPIEKI